jgi:hypothetical protein
MREETSSSSLGSWQTPMRPCLRQWMTSKQRAGPAADEQSERRQRNIRCRHFWRNGHNSSSSSACRRSNSRRAISAIERRNLLFIPWVLATPMRPFLRQWMTSKQAPDRLRTGNRNPRQEREFCDRRPGVEIALLPRTETGISLSGDEKPLSLPQIKSLYIDGAVR